PYGCPFTLTGTLLPVVEPLPSWPTPPSPQQYAVPPALRLQLCVAPALREENVNPPATATGTQSALVAPPQQYAAPLIVIPQVGDSPALTAANVSAPATGTGTGAVMVKPAEPLPSWPEKFHPQQYAAPPVVTPQVRDWPALTDVNVSPPATGTATERADLAATPGRPSV